MCGITGTIGFVDKALMEKMTTVMHHRGPDDGGIEIFLDKTPVGFGFRRLAIIDLSPLGHQPMFNADKTLCIVFNGEIYNYQEVKSELLKKGYVFKSATDTEVILHAYTEWGNECVQRLRGMWAFAIYDLRNDVVFISRDRLGEKPLYFTRLPNNRLIFASEVKSILQSHEVAKQIDADGILSTLFFLWTPEPKTAFKNIEKLPAGCNLIFKSGEMKIERYWDVNFEGYGEDKDEQTYIDELDALLRKTVKEQMVADVKVGAFLSGGLDSSLVTALMTKEKGEPITTYTIAFTDEDKKFEAMPDDQKYAKIVAKHLNADYREIVIKPDIVELLPKMIYHLDEPIADPASINTYLICKMAKESGTTVMLSGMGADEIFGGYRKHLSVKLASTYKQIPRLLRSKVIEPIVENLPVAGTSGGYRTTRWAKKFLKAASLPDFDAFIGNYSYYNASEMTQLLTPEFREQCYHSHYDSYPIRRHYALREQFLKQKPNLDLITLMCAVDTKCFLASLNLTYSDKASMAASVEERVPLVDYKVAEFAHRLPARYKINGLTQKYLLKKVAEKYLPKEIIYRPKAPFGAPLRAWVKKDLDPLIQDCLSEEQVKRRGIFNPKMVHDIIERDKTGKEDNAHRIWALLTIELWLQHLTKQ
ncbi:MAG: asparagine synthase (glutamine-hydrolyzing) [Chloroherpetonaceae bacterium]